MRVFSYHRATSLEDAARLLAQAGARPLGGGTDLLPSIDDGILAPDAIIDLRGVSRQPPIATTDDGGLHLAAAARLHDLGTSDIVTRDAPALALACGASASPALRHMGTLGGNLAQRPRCWYLRRGVSCHKNGGTACPAEHGQNQHHAILEGGPCWMVHPSDPAVALLALDATVHTRRADASRAIGIGDFFVLPGSRMDSETVLEAGEFITGVTIPAAATGGRQVFRKLTQRGAWDFALASIAGVRRRDGSVRLALGGVAPRPWRVPESIEEDVASGGLDEDSIGALAERALYDAKPLATNGYKVEMAMSLLKDTMRELAA